MEKRMDSAENFKIPKNVVIHYKPSYKWLLMKLLGYLIILFFLF